MVKTLKKLLNRTFTKNTIIIEPEMAQKEIKNLEKNTYKIKGEYHGK